MIAVLDPDEGGGGAGVQAPAQVGSVYWPVVDSWHVP